MMSNVSDSSAFVPCPLANIDCASSWAGTQVVIRSLRVADYTHELYDEELPAIVRAAPLRQKSFSSGRRVARLAMQDAGFTKTALPKADDGSVLWPQDLSGSVSHTNDWAVAIVTVHDQCAATSIGIDLERIKPLEAGVKRLIATSTELEQLSGVAVPDWQAVALFSMKESIYKCLAKDFGRFIEFHDVEVTGLDRGCPVVRFCNADLSCKYPVSQLELRLAVSEQQVLTLAWLRG